MTPPSAAVEIAVRNAMLSRCRSKRGVVIFKGDIRDGYVISTGFNYRPMAFGGCNGSVECKASCRYEAVHAEQQALLIAGASRVIGADLLHVKAVDGQPVPSGGPSCVECSKLMIVAGIQGVWLLHEAGWHRYDIYDFHAVSLLTAAKARTLFQRE